tara:strand:+ start:214 stop:567 length:354 start_codon:yes stop_codon:yes gene_type:complete
METKDQLINNVKEWIQIDNEITELRARIRVMNNKKKIITEKLLNVMKIGKIDCFDINGGALVYKTNKVKKPINGKSLLTALQAYYKSDPTVAEDVVKHIMDNREEQFKDSIKLKIDK